MTAPKVMSAQDWCAQKGVATFDDANAYAAYRVDAALEEAATLAEGWMFNENSPGLQALGMQIAPSIAREIRSMKTKK